MSLVEELGPGLSGRALLQTLIDTDRRPAICDTLDFVLTEVGDGSAVFTGTPGPGAANPMGAVHGGYAATLLDSACGCAVHTTLPADRIYTTVELKIAYHRAILPGAGPLRAEGRVVSSGRRVAFAEAKLTDAAGRLLASATSTLLVMER